MSNVIRFRYNADRSGAGILYREGVNGLSSVKTPIAEEVLALTAEDVRAILDDMDAHEIEAQPPARLGGPTIETYIAAGYPAETYPPFGFAPMPSDGWDAEQRRRADAGEPQEPVREPLVPAAVNEGATTPATPPSTTGASTGPASAFPGAPGGPGETLHGVTGESVSSSVTSSTPGGPGAGEPAVPPPTTPPPAGNNGSASIKGRKP